MSLTNDRTLEIPGLPGAPTVPAPEIPPAPPAPAPELPRTPPDLPPNVPGEPRDVPDVPAPEPTGPPAPILRGGSIAGSAPPSRASTMPVRTFTTRVPQPTARCASASQLVQTVARKSDPAGVSSVTISSPCGP